MDLSELIMNIQQLAPQLASTCCVINGAFMTLEDVEKMGYDEFLYRSKINMPLRLYKYFSNAENDKEGSKVNYSMIALKNNTVYMQSPSLFDDVYDSEINIDYYDYHKYRLLEYCRRCGLPVDESKTIENIGIELLKAIQESVEKNKDFDHIFTVSPTSEIESMQDLINSEERLWRQLSELNIIDVEVRMSWLKPVCILERYPQEERMKNRIYHGDNRLVQK